MKSKNTFPESASVAEPQGLPKKLKARGKMGRLEAGRRIATMLRNNKCAPDGFMPIQGYANRYSVSKCGKVFSHYFGKCLKGTDSGAGYLTVQFGLRGKREYIHSIVAEVFIGPRPDGAEVDHRNRNKHDNRASNLRYVPHHLNQHNMSKSRGLSRFRGVSLSYGKWRAAASFNKRRYYCGVQPDEKSAALAYDALVTRLRGPDAVTNKVLGLLP